MASRVIWLDVDNYAESAMNVSVVARWRQIILILAGGISLFVTLFTWALGSPPASGPDERFHYGFIWCPDDAVNGACLDVKDEGNSELRVRYAVPSYVCFLGQPDRPAKCSDSPTTSETVIVRGAYPPGYYSFASLFVSNDAESSVLRIRLLNSVLAATMLVGTALITRGRLRSAYLVSLLLFLGPLHLSLLSSTHHQSWSIVALSTGWALVLVIVEPRAGTRRLWGGGLWLLGLLLATSSRWEGGPYFVYLSGLALLPLVITRLRPMRNGRLLIGGLIVVVAATQLPLWPLSIRRWVTGVNTSALNPDGPDVLTWFTSWLFHFPSVIVEVFGGGGMATDDIPIPSFGPTVGPLILGGVCAFALVRAGRVQVLTAVVQLLVILLSILYYTNIELDLFTLPGRYVTPLFAALVGLLVHQSRAGIQFFDQPSLRRTMLVLLGVFHALALHAYVERFVVGSHPSIGFLDVTTESWWWDRVPVGPNHVILIGSAFFAVFLFAASRLVGSPFSSETELVPT
jgi:hypothetical protein